MADKCSEIIDFLIQDYLQDYTEILGITVGIANFYPQQADSQIRNALTHLSRAAQTDNKDLIAKEIKKAKGHIERAKRDCLKIAIIEKRQQIKDMIIGIYFAKGGLPKKIQKKRIEIEINRKITAINETKGEEIAQELEFILSELFDLEEQILEFDTLAHQPSKLVRYVTAIILYAKKISNIILIVTISAFVGYFINGFL